VIDETEPSPTPSKPSPGQGPKHPVPPRIYGRGWGGRGLMFIQRTQPVHALVRRTSWTRPFHRLKAIQVGEEE
jgi:hypothetical protein